MGWLTLKSYGGPEYPGSLFYFFENNFGFHFCNIEQYIEINQGMGPTFTYLPQQSANETLNKSYFRAIQHISGLQIPNAIDRMNDGTFSHTVRELDLISKNHVDLEFNMKEKFHTFTKPGNIFNTSEQFFDNFASAKDNKGTFTGVNPYEYLVTKDPTNTETNVENTVGARNAYTNLLNSYKLTIIVHGDSNLNVGDVVNVMLPETGTAEDRDLSIYSGSWLVQALNHTCDNEKFNTTLSLSKAGLEFQQTKT